MYMQTQGGRDHHLLKIVVCLCLLLQCGLHAAQDILIFKKEVCGILYNTAQSLFWWTSLSHTRPGFNSVNMVLKVAQQNESIMSTVHMRRPFEM